MVCCAVTRSVSSCQNVFFSKRSCSRYWNDSGVTACSSRYRSLDVGSGGVPNRYFSYRRRSASSIRSLPMYSRIAYSANGPFLEKANELVARRSGRAARGRGVLSMKRTYRRSCSGPSVSSTTRIAEYVSRPVVSSPPPSTSAGATCMPHHSRATPCATTANTASRSCGLSPGFSIENPSPYSTVAASVCTPMPRVGFSISLM